jgi:hypothetical protein
MSRRLILAVLCCCWLACKRPDPGLRLVTYSGFNLHLINIKSADSATTAYKVRVILTETKLKEQVTSEITHGLLYNTDSLFYIQESKRKVYPILIQPVANGVANTFEYLIDFDKKENEADASMIYHDKYLTKKDYRVKLI